MIGHVLNSMNEIITNEYNENHQALDIVSSDYSQTDIIALESGIVEDVVKNIESTNHSSTGMATYGNYVKIKQNDGKTALYAHMKYGSINVNIGDYIEKGSIIGTMGSTGNAYGNHLHLEIKNQNGIKENPLIELNKQKPQNDLPTEPTIEVTSEIKDENKNIETTKVIEEKKDISLIEEEKSDKNKAKEKQNPIKENITYISNQKYLGGSIVDGLKEIDIDSSYEYRKNLAQKNGIDNYRGSYEQNVKLLSLLKKGNLIKA